jgi:hypothetical protein
MKISLAESREDRFRRLTLRESLGCQCKKPEIKLASTLSEWKASYHLHYKEYLNAGYVKDDIPSRLIFGIHNLLPETVVLVAKIDDLIVSTLTQFFDDPVFGLPLDMIYKKELDQLRAKGHKISEIGALATRHDFRWQNLFMHLCQVMYWYARFRKVDDLCIAVNPKHVQFYKTVFLFEELGPTKLYPKVHAPAVLMRLDANRHEEIMGAAYDRMENEFNLHNRWHKFEGYDITDYFAPLKRRGILHERKHPMMNSTDVNFFLSQEEEILRGLSPKQAYSLKTVYPEMKLLYLVN